MQDSVFCVECCSWTCIRSVSAQRLKIESSLFRKVMGVLTGTKMVRKDKPNNSIVSTRPIAESAVGWRSSPQGQESKVRTQVIVTVLVR
jgi:hypothetical protein